MNLPDAPKCLVFPDGDDWIVYAPVSHLVLRSNEAGAQRFRGFVDVGSNLGEPSAPPEPSRDELGFPPTNVTIMTSNMCGQRCVYCYGTPAHANRSVLNQEFCRVALELMATRAREARQPVRAFFHGVGEPTFAWTCFQECVGIVRETGDRSGVPTFLRLCSGGQISDQQAEWIAEHFDEVNVSLDGPRDIQNRQRPRQDGRDSFDGPLRLARAVVKRGKKLCMKTTVTELTVHRTGEIVEFVAREIGRVRLDLCMMFQTPWVDTDAAQPPLWQQYVAEFGKALDLGARLGVKVRHPTISFESLCSGYSFNVATHFCLAPPNIVTSFFDVPEEGAGTPSAGAYGWYDAATRTLHFDHDKRRRLEEQQALSECRCCACGPACLGAAGVKGRVPREVTVLGPVCQARIGVLKELLRRVVPKRGALLEVGV
ncbi:MAG TPA: radical SAM protein [Verrucomicrobiae bacterium]|nr:radical SAM protein [Verrucomicrobiae bacterium]